MKHLVFAGLPPEQLSTLEANRRRFLCEIFAIVIMLSCLDVIDPFEVARSCAKAHLFSS